MLFGLLKSIGIGLFVGAIMALIFIAFTAVWILIYMLNSIIAIIAGLIVLLGGIVGAIVYFEP